jgi:nucleoside-diphosphate-sugar epimerase
LARKSFLVAGGTGFIGSLRRVVVDDLHAGKRKKGYGPRQDSTGEAEVVAISTAGTLANLQVTTNGDGCQRRDFVQSHDVTHANLPASDSVGSGIFNLGTSVAIDINTMLRELAQLTGYSCSERHGSPGGRRASDRPRLLSCSSASGLETASSTLRRTRSHSGLFPSAMIVS